MHIVAAVHTVLVLAAPPTLAPEQATPSSSPISAGNELSTGEGRGRLSNKNHPDPHARPARPGEEKTHNKGIVRSRPGGLGPQTLGYCVPGPGLSPHKAQPLNNGAGGGWGVAEARWSDEGKPDRRTDTSLFQESQEEGEAGLKKRGRGGERPALPRATPVGEGQPHLPSRTEMPLRRKLDWSAGGPQAVWGAPAKNTQGFYRTSTLWEAPDR